MRNSTAVSTREGLDSPRDDAPELRAAEAPAAEANSDPRRRRGRPRLRPRRRQAAPAVAGAAGEGMLLLARVVMWVASVIALLIAAAIVLFDAGANPGNSIAKGVHEGANIFAGAFTGLITFSGHPKRALTVDWGIALVAFLVIGALIADVFRAFGRGGLRLQREHSEAGAPLR